MIPQILPLADTLYRIAINIEEQSESDARLHLVQNRIEARARNIDHRLILVVRCSQDNRADGLSSVACVFRLDLIDQPIAFLQSVIRGHKPALADARATAQNK